MDVHYKFGVSFFKFIYLFTFNLFIQKGHIQLWNPISTTE